MKKIIIGFLLVIFSLTTVYAVSLNLVANAPRRYVVQPGDTLWGIATKYLQKPWEWHRLWRTNPHISNPNLICPGDILVLYQHNGQPALRLERHGVVKLYPNAKIVFPTQGIPIIPFNEIKPFITGVQVVSKTDLDTSAYIIGIESGEVSARDESHIFVRDLQWPNRQYYSIFRVGAELVDPLTGEPLGIEAFNIGDARLVQLGDPATLIVTKAFREILPRDRLLPTPSGVEPQDFYPHAPSIPVFGQIISMLSDSDITTSQYQTVIIDRGLANGIRRGDVLAIYQTGNLVVDPMQATPPHYDPDANLSHHAQVLKLPDERVGEIIIFRTFMRVSYGLIVYSRKPIYKNDWVSNP